MASFPLFNYIFWTLLKSCWCRWNILCHVIERLLIDAATNNVGHKACVGAETNILNSICKTVD